MEERFAGVVLKVKGGREGEAASVELTRWRLHRGTKSWDG